ncbi:acyltransferase [Brachybacterium huguangmaarense]|uniref:Acyltransferase n=1 Tax=Brachybacterium huguangmaarense TaxID=1652028 RepID=A0ABY6G4A1_9MICO|nr:acyltransferase family protein [Brachybacterium huguangmaarense]UYG17937.1 acyltransferase [Brachybacterium huguangmaarense]
MTDSPAPPRGRRRGSPLSRRDEQLRGHRVAPGRHHRHRADTGTVPLSTAEPSSATAQVAEADVAPVDSGRQKKGPGSYRPELQGLRAVAILMVVCYHIWFGRVSGGVDIFLLISAFLLTGSFARKLERGAPLQVPRYWLHAFKRLVPPGALVILGTLGASLLVLPATRWVDLLSDSVASLIYGENWLLASRSVDYYAADHSTASPLQHYWSLSIQGQVFFLWPLLFLLAALLIRRFRLPVRATLLTLFGAITVVSFAWSVHLTATDQAYAYFDTRSRLWEFSLGSVLALVLPLLEQRIGYRQSRDPRSERGRHVRALLGWAGLALILSCGWVVDVQGAFPGWIALWPLLAACLVIAAGPTGTGWGADRLLSSRPLQWLGDISYALYLVHWPLLILTLVAFGSTGLDVWQGALLVATSVLLAWALTRFVDSPIRYSPRLEARWWRSALVIVTSCAVVLAAVGTVRYSLDARTRAIEADAARNNPGARSLTADYVDEADADASPLPDLAMLPDDWYSTGGPCRGALAPDSADGPVSGICAQEGNGRGRVVAIVGDSRDQQAAPALASLALREGWTVVTLFSGGCVYSTGPDAAPWCSDHNAFVTDYLLRTQPDLVVTSATWISPDFHEIATPGHAELARTIMDHGISVLGERAIPRLDGSPVECLEDGRSDASSCTFDVHEEYAQDAPWPQPAPTGEEAARYYTADLSEDICPDRACVPEIGNVYVWIDAAHISTTYSRTLSGALDEQLGAQGFTWG